ncbi:MAG: hypothetical protein HY855_02815 [Burkholderiales bacterium]|nr:hypothetical protein [Burkholderiales bacterium]
MTFKNITTEALSVTPRVSLIDANGRMLNPTEFEPFMATASTLAGTPPPAIPAFGPDYYRTTGTVTSAQTGNVYRYSGTTTPAGGFASGFSQGYAMGNAMNAARDREEGRSHTLWAGGNWLRSSYTIPPGATALGVLFFPAPSVGAVPITVNVNAAGQTFSFKTAAR